MKALIQFIAMAIYSLGVLTLLGSIGWKFLQFTRQSAAKEKEEC